MSPVYFVTQVLSTLSLWHRRKTISGTPNSENDNRYLSGAEQESNLRGVLRTQESDRQGSRTPRFVFVREKNSHLQVNHFGGKPESMCGEGN